MHIYLSIYACDLPHGEFSLGIHSQRGQDENGNEFYEICLGILFFEICLGKIK